MYKVAVYRLNSGVYWRWRLEARLGEMPLFEGGELRGILPLIGQVLFTAKAPPLVESSN